MRIAITGGAGFIGTNLAAALFGVGQSVTILDRHDMLSYMDHDPVHNATLLAGHDAVVHLAANADVRSGWEHPQLDLEQNTGLTCAVLAGMQMAGVRRLVFASTGSVYHPAAVGHYHHESCELQATSLYAASKIASEQYIHAYAAAGHIDPTIVRLVSVLGPHYSHGHVIDFVKKLKPAPNAMEIIGSGFQHKGYVHARDVAEAIWLLLHLGVDGVGTYNVGTASYATPIECAGWVAEALGVPVPGLYPTMKSWPGDNPNIVLDCSKLRLLGWRPSRTIEEAIKETAQWINTRS